MIRRPLHRSDSNRTEVVRALRAAGIRVYDLGEPVDLLTLFRGVVRLVELKSGSRKRLTPSQENFFREWSDAPLFRVESVEQAFECHGIHERAT